MPDPLTTELRAHRTAQAAERLATQFGSMATGLLPPRSASRSIPATTSAISKRLCRAAGVPERRLHDLRHSAATALLIADVDLATAGAMLGHSRVDMTRRYTHVLADRQRVAADRMSDVLFGAQGWGETRLVGESKLGQKLGTSLLVAGNGLGS